MIKYLDFDAPNINMESTSVTFEAESSDKTVMFKNDIALLKKTGVELYDLSGQKIMSTPYSISNPNAVCGSRYMLIYDLGGNYAAVFNTFSKIWEKTFDYPIISADINDEGNFCIVTSEKGYHSAVYVYDRNFNKIYKWLSSDKFVLDVSMSKNDPSKFIISTLRAENGTFVSEMILLSAKSDTILASLILNDEMVLDVSMNSKISTVISDKALTFFDPETLKIKNQQFYSRDSLKDFSSNDNLTALVLVEKIIGSNNQIMVFSDEGNLINTISSQGQILDIAIGEKKIYQLISGLLTVYDPVTLEKTQHTVERRYDSLLVYLNSVILVSDSDAISLKGE